MVKSSKPWFFIACAQWLSHNQQSLVFSFFNSEQNNSINSAIIPPFSNHEWSVNEKGFFLNTEKNSMFIPLSQWISLRSDEHDIGMDFTYCEHNEIDGITEPYCPPKWFLHASNKKNNNTIVEKTVKLICDNGKIV